MFMFFKVLTLSLFYSKLSLKYKTDYLIGMNTDNMNKSFPLLDGIIFTLTLRKNTLKVYRNIFTPYRE